MINEIKTRTSWPFVDEVEIKGDYRGRAVKAKYKDNSLDFFITFRSNGQILEFKKL